MDESTEWVSLSEAARILGVHPATVRNWADRGHLPSQRTPGGHRRFRVADLNQWADTHRGTSSAEVQLLVQSAMGRARLEIGEGQLTESPWYREMDEQSRALMALYGRRLLEGLERFLSTGADAALGEARTFGFKYGEMLRAHRVKLREAVRAFFTFNDLVIASAIQVTEMGRTSSDRGEAIRKVYAFTREVVLALVGAYEG